MTVLVLWDVDHTLVENSGVSKETYAAAFERIAGRPPEQPARTNGRTDRLIMADMFRAHAVEQPAWPVVYAALESAGTGLFDDMRTRGFVLPGAAEAIEALAHVPDVVQSLLTGNILPNARMKVTAVGLGAGLDFEVGAYGSDSDDRSELVKVAQERASAAYGMPFSSENTVLVGDTPRDVTAGAQGGAHVIAVASGLYPVAQLAEAGTATVLPDLRDTAGFVAEVARLASRTAS